MTYVLSVNDAIYMVIQFLIQFVGYCYDRFPSITVPAQKDYRHLLCISFMFDGAYKGRVRVPRLPFSPSRRRLPNATARTRRLSSSFTRRWSIANPSSPDRATV